MDTMDPITLAIVSAITVGVVEGATSTFTEKITKVAGEAINYKYQKLKTLLMKGYGEDSEVVRAVESLESNPKSEGRKLTLQEEVANSKVIQDPDLIRIAQDILKQIMTHTSTEQHKQLALGDFIAQADHGGKASVNITQVKE